MFALGLIHLAGRRRELSGSIALLSGAVILCTSLTECSLYFAAVGAGRIGDTSALMTSLALIGGLTMR